MPVGVRSIRDHDAAAMKYDDMFFLADELGLGSTGCTMVALPGPPQKSGCPGLNLSCVTGRIEGEESTLQWTSGGALSSLYCLAADLACTSRI